MTREEALKSVGSLLALDTYKWLENLKTATNLEEMTKEHVARNLEVAKTLEVDNVYRHTLRLLDVSI